MGSAEGSGREPSPEGCPSKLDKNEEEAGSKGSGTETT